MSRRSPGMVALAAVAVAVMLFGLSASATAEAAPSLKVVATFSILGDLVRQVGGDAVQVTTLVGPGGDAHVYQPSPADAKTVAQADLVVVNGLGLEGWLDRLIAASGYKGRIVVASDGVPTQSLMEDEPGHRTPERVTDPHAWQNLRDGQIYVRNISAALEAADPSHRADYAGRAEDYGRQLGALDAWVRQQIDQVPPAKRKIITSHDAFGYFATAYGVTFLAPVGLNTDSEPTAAGMGRLIRQIRKEGIKALFIENMSDPRLIRQLARETGAVVGGALYSDSLSEAGGPADTYLKMFRHNLPAMVAAMQGN